MLNHRAGTLFSIDHRTFIITNCGFTGFVLSGPYLTLQPGHYDVVVTVSCLMSVDLDATAVTLDVTAESGRIVLTRRDLAARDMIGPVVLSFEVSEELRDVEFRAFVVLPDPVLMSEFVSGPLGFEHNLIDGRTALSKIITDVSTNSGANPVVDTLDVLADKLRHIEYRLQGAQAVYVNQNRILTRAFVRNKKLLYFVEADDLLLTPHFIVSGEYEPSLTNFFSQNIRSDSNCLDIGANFGYFTVLMASFAPDGKTIGVEADPMIFALARDNVSANWCTNVTMLNAAASAEVGSATLYRRIGRSGNTSMAEVYRPDLGEPSPMPFTIEALSLDSLMPKFEGRVDLMKVDVEGAEPLVFRGARRLIENNPSLRIVMEWAPAQVQSLGFDIAEFHQDLLDLGFSASIVRNDGSLETIAFDDLLSNNFLTGIHLVRN